MCMCMCMYWLCMFVRWPVRAVFTSKLHTSKFHVILQVGNISKSTRATVDTTNSRDGLSGVLRCIMCVVRKLFMCV